MRPSRFLTRSAKDATCGVSSFRFESQSAANASAPDWQVAGMESVATVACTAASK